jgi:hypothetical protein
MPSDRRPASLSLALLLAAAGLGVWIWLLQEPTERPAAPYLASAGNSMPVAPAHPSESQGDNLLAPSADSAARAELAARLQDRLNRPGIRANEAILTFKDAAAYRRFLERARAAGVEVVAKIDSLHAVRVRVGDYAGFVGDIAGNIGDYASVGANPVLAATPPPEETRAARPAVPVGENLLSVLGIAPGVDTSSWGRGVLVAVLDGGASAVPSLGTRIKYLDIGYGLTGLGSDGAHGTAVASLVAGASADAKGVAPAAEVLSVRVTGADGVSDAFALAQGVLAAIDAGAKVINISLGGYSTSPVLGAAIEEALAAGVAVVASSGNDQTNRLAWPAAYPGVLSVGATDAAGVQTIFSNSGEGLQITAPGYALQAAGTAGAPVSFSGTSASAPVAAGAIAVMMSQSPGLTALEAADILVTHANDGGAAGADPDYGNGTLNLGWAMNHANPSFSDPAISSQSYDPAAGTISIVVQNRGTTPLPGLSLAVVLDGASTRKPVGDLAPGASTTVTVPVSAARRDAGGTLFVTSRLSTSANDQNPANNRQQGSVTLR